MLSWRALVIVVALGNEGCTSSSSQSTPRADAPRLQLIGADGGRIASSDGRLEISIPQGALASDVTITVQVASSTVAGFVGSVYEVGPTGTKLALPATLSFHYAGVDLRGKVPSELRVGTIAANAWSPLAAQVNDSAALTISGVTSHFSPFALYVAANGQTCFDVLAPVCASSGPNPGSCPPAPTCSSSPPQCSGYPGATRAECTDTPLGYRATCCFPPGAESCLSAGRGALCTGGTGGTDGGTTCEAPPTCESSPPCMGYAGSTLKSCANSSNGYEAVCCFPAGTPPPPPDAGPPANGGAGSGCAADSPGIAGCVPPRCQIQCPGPGATCEQAVIDRTTGTPICTAPPRCYCK